MRASLVPGFEWCSDLYSSEVLVEGTAANVKLGLILEVLSETPLSVACERAPIATILVHYVLSERNKRLADEVRMTTGPTTYVNST